jgi:hypothetical protein
MLHTEDNLMEAMESVKFVMDSTEVVIGSEQSTQATDHDRIELQGTQATDREAELTVIPRTEGDHTELQAPPATNHDRIELQGTQATDRKTELTAVLSTPGATYRETELTVVPSTEGDHTEL